MVRKAEIPRWNPDTTRGCPPWKPMCGPQGVLARPER